MTKTKTKTKTKTETETKTGIYTYTYTRPHARTPKLLKICMMEPERRVGVSA